MKINLCIALAAIAASPVAFAQTRFAVIGDYGVDNANQLAVSNAVKAAGPDFVTTTGDNTYFVGATPAEKFNNWDRTQGKYYAPFIKLPAGSAHAAQGAATNNFFPVLGNHDLDEGYDSYSSYFSLPTNPSGNSYYYSFKRGPVEFFMLVADPRADSIAGVGRSPSSTQYQWAESAIRSSTAAWQVVMFHQPAYTYSSNHGPELAMRWNFDAWGVDAIFSGHNHNMQAMTVTDTPGSGVPYFVQGASGNGLYSINGQPSGATGLFSNASSFGYSLVTATDTTFRVDFNNTAGNTLYSQNVSANTPGPNPPPPPPVTPPSPAALSITGYSEDFNSMGVSGTVTPLGFVHRIAGSGSNGTFTNATGIPASAMTSITWTATTLSAIATLPGTGTNNNGYNAPAFNSPLDTADRAIATSPTGVAGALIELALQNLSGFDQPGIVLSYDIERYRSVGTNNELPGYQLFYSLDNGFNWLAVDALDPTLAGPAGVIVPNTTGVTSVSDALVTFNTAWETGDVLLLRWVDDNAAQTSPDQIVGLDNVRVAPVAVPEPAALSILALAALATARRRSR